MLEGRLDNLRQYLFVIRQISYKENKRKIDETNLGIVWNVLNPLLYMLILSTYYQNVVRHDNVANFPVFVFTGITMMNYFSNATKSAMRSLVSNKSLLIKTHLPTEIFLLQKVVMAFREMMYSAIALIPIMIYFKIPLSWRVVQIVPVLLLISITIFGIGELLAIAYVYFADIDYLYSVFMTMMLFVSGVFIPISHMPGKLQGILTYNPIFLAIYLTRNCLVYNLPSHWTAWVKLLMWAVLAGTLGHYVFVKNKNKIIGKI